MMPALNRHPLVGTMLADRARSISKTPASEAVILVAHGPVPDEDNRRWLDDMAVLAEQVQATAPFASVDSSPYVTMRAAVRGRHDGVASEVEKHRAAGRKC
jgi:hypothetical protein